MIIAKNLYKEYRINTSKKIFNREYEIKKAVKDISFYIDKGEIVGFIGPNGAGKSTTINILAGALLPTSGMVRINGIEPYKNRIQNALQIGAVFGQRTQLWEEMPLIESFEMAKYMYKISDKQYKENMQLFCQLLDLKEILYVPPKKLSLGQRVRADFAYANLHNPEILYLDEPTIGLDVVAKEKVLNFIYEVNKLRKTTVLFTTHNLADIEKICSRIMVIDRGEMVYDGNIKGLKDVYASEHTIQLKIDEMKLPDLQDLPISKYTIENGEMYITYDNKIIHSSIILKHIVKQCAIKDVKMYEPSLRNIIGTIYSRRVESDVRTISEGRGDKQDL